MSTSLWQSAHVQVFVTGVAGFVGRRLEARLRAAGIRVIGTDVELNVADANGVADAVSAARPDAIVATRSPCSRPSRCSALASRRERAIASAIVQRCAGLSIVTDTISRPP